MLWLKSHVFLGVFCCQEVGFHKDVTDQGGKPETNTGPLDFNQVALNHKPLVARCFEDVQLGGIGKKGWKKKKL